MLYYETVQKAVDFIESHLKEDISLYDISQYVNFSVPHFYRIFKAIAGETVKSYILKRKLSCAADELNGNNRNISEIAYEYGFESHNVFTRAFFRIYNMSPSKYRDAGIVCGFDRLVYTKILPYFSINACFSLFDKMNTAPKLLKKSCVYSVVAGILNS